MAVVDGQAVVGALSGSVRNARRWATATVAALIEREGSGFGQTVTVTYKGGEKKVNIPADVPVVTLVPAAPADIHAGDAVFVPGQRQADGSIQAGVVLFGKDGLVPPM